MSAPSSNDDTIRGLLPYVLTDGRNCVELRWLTDEQFTLANERACIASGSAWEWIPLSAASDLMGVQP